MRLPSFARRHPWIGLLIVVTIAVASWMLLRAPHPATESMPLAAAACVFSGVLQNVIGGLLAACWKRRTPDA